MRLRRSSYVDVLKLPDSVFVRLPSGDKTSLTPGSINDEAKARLREAFAVAAGSQSGHALDILEGTVPRQWKFDADANLKPTTGAEQMALHRSRFSHSRDLSIVVD